MSRIADGTAWIRTSMLLSPDGDKLLRDLCAKYPEITKSTLVEAVVRFISPEVLVEASKRLTSLKESEKTRRREAIKRISALPVDELEKLSSKAD